MSKETKNSLKSLTMSQAQTHFPKTNSCHKLEQTSRQVTNANWHPKNMTYICSICCLAILALQPFFVCFDHVCNNPEQAEDHHRT